MNDNPKRSPRRRWLLRSLQAAVAATWVAIFYPMIRFLWPRRSTVSGAPQVVVPFSVGEITTTEHNPFDFAGTPCLVVLSKEGADRLAQGEPLKEDDVRAFDAVCTHLACTVEYRSQDGNIFCNCHNGVFDLEGRPVSGPPPRPLTSYKVTLRGDPGKEEIVVSRS